MRFRFLLCALWRFPDLFGKKKRASRQRDGESRRGTIGKGPSVVVVERVNVRDGYAHRYVARAGGPLVGIRTRHPTTPHSLGRRRNERGSNDDVPVELNFTASC